MAAAIRLLLRAGGPPQRQSVGRLPRRRQSSSAALDLRAAPHDIGWSGGDAAPVSPLRRCAVVGDAASSRSRAALGTAPDGRGNVCLRRPGLPCPNSSRCVDDPDFGRGVGVAGLCSQGVGLHRAGRRLPRGCVMRVCAGLAVLVGVLVFGGVCSPWAFGAVTPGWECIPTTAGQAVVSGGAGASPSCGSGTAVLAPTYVAAGVGGKPTVEFSTVNVQVVSGSGATDGAVNGTGNLIVGYAENVNRHAQSGSNDLICGRGQWVERLWGDRRRRQRPGEWLLRDRLTPRRAPMA